MMEDGKPVDLCIATPELSSYGIQENRQRTEPKHIESHSLPLLIHDQSTIDVFETILKRCQKHLNNRHTKKSLGKFKLAPEKNEHTVQKTTKGLRTQYRSTTDDVSKTVYKIRK